MYIKRFTNLVFILALTLSISTQGLAKDHKAPEKGISPATVEQVDLINKLITLGDSRKDPILLLAAAQLQKNLSNKDIAPSGEKPANKEILKRAKKLSKGRKDIAGLADDIDATKSKGWNYGIHSGYSRREWNQYSNY